MYLRTIARRNKDGTTVRYLQLAHNVRNERGNAVAEVVHSFGREDELDRDALARLVRSISRFLDPEQALAASVGSELAFTGSRPYGGGYLLDALWRRLGIDKALTAAAAGRKVSAATERLIFTLVANRALDPSSKRHALEWAAADVALPGVGELGGEPQVFYRAMDFLLDADPQIQEQVFFAVANLLNLEVDVLLFDTTSTYFETENDDELRRYGHSKDHRPDRPQVVIGLAVTKDGIPVRVWCWPGNAADKTVIRQVHDDLRAWSLHRLLWVGDAGFTSADNRSYLQRAGGQVLFAEKLRQGNDNHAALARQGRYAIIDDNLHVKEVRVGDGAQPRRFVVCRNLHETERDAARRERALTRLRDELAAIDTKTGDARLAAEGELLANPTLRRYLTRVGNKLIVDTTKVKAEQRLDGKFLLSATDPTIPAADLAKLYKGLLDVERCWRDLKQVIDIRPVYHSKDQRIRAHVLLCYLALMLIRFAENTTGLTWNRIRSEIQRMHLGEFAGAAGHLQQRTETTPTQREILHALKIKEPPVIVHHAGP
jgi:hypothetical protein